MIDVIYVSNPTAPKANSLTNVRGLFALLAYYDALSQKPGGPRKDEWIITNFHAIVGSKIYLPAITNRTPQFECNFYAYENAEGQPIISLTPIKDKSLIRIRTTSTSTPLWKVDKKRPTRVRVRFFDSDGKLNTKILELDGNGLVTLKPGDKILSVFGVLSDGAHGTGVFAKGGPWIGTYRFEDWGDYGIFADWGDWGDGGGGG
jgi:hypothetical protein